MLGFYQKQDRSKTCFKDCDKNIITSWVAQITSHEENVYDDLFTYEYKQCYSVTDELKTILFKTCAFQARTQL